MRTGLLLLPVLALCLSGCPGDGPSTDAKANARADAGADAKANTDAGVDATARADAGANATPTSDAGADARPSADAGAQVNACAPTPCPSATPWDPAGCRCKAPPKTYELTRSGGTLEVNDAYRTCRVDADCELVDATCNGCCTVTAIDVRLRDRYRAERTDACADYRGPICDCDPERVEARCVAGLCSKVPETARTIECRQVNAELEAAYAELVVCDKLADCGKMLPKLGSCGCTTDAVGRRDADVSVLEKLLERRSELSDLPQCENLGGPCVCPAVGGVDCVDHACAWVKVDEGEACHALQGTFVSDQRLECGLGPNGVALCSWSLQFTYGTFSWQHSDVSETGSYACRAGTLAAATGGGASYHGQVTSDGKLTFEGATYTYDPTR